MEDFTNLCVVEAVSENNEDSDSSPTNQDISVGTISDHIENKMSISPDLSVNSNEDPNENVRESSIETRTESKHRISVVTINIESQISTLIELVHTGIIKGIDLIEQSKSVKSTGMIKFLETSDPQNTDEENFEFESGNLVNHETMLLIENEHQDNNELVSESHTGARRQEDKFDIPTESSQNKSCEENPQIVMMNDDESFITVIQEDHITPVEEETFYHFPIDDTGEDFCFVDLKKPPDTKSLDENILADDDMTALSETSEDTPVLRKKEPGYGKFRRRFSMIERKFSGLSFTKSKKPDKTSSGFRDDDNASGYRPISGVRKKLAFSRRINEKRKSDIGRPHWLQQEESYSSFGKRSQGGGRRPNECLILEPSETIAIDYPHVELIHPGQRCSLNQRTYDKFLGIDADLSMKGGWSANRKPVAPPRMPGHAEAMPHYSHPESNVPVHHDQCLPDLLRGGSVGSSIRDGSDTSSAYSGSDTMCQSLHSLDREEVDFSGLRESMVDSDEEDLAESIENLSVRDAVRECLEKDPSERNEDDIKVLLEFTERLSAFANMTVSVRRAMCQSMVFAVVEEAGTILMNDGEELDSWSVIINGHVEITYSDGTIQELHLGDSFGITPTTEKLYHRGVMRSKVEDCQFVCIRQSDYYRILHQGEENTQRHEEDGRLVLVTEQRLIEACHRKGNIVIKGTPERLMQQLVEVANELDPTYVEDFLLTHRTFIDTPLIVASKLLQWFEDPKHQDRVTRVVLRWVQSHFTDFEMDPQMMNFLEKFEEGLEKKKMTGQLLLLRVACVSKARNRLVTLTRPCRDDALQFVIVGRKEFGIFIASVEPGSKAEEGGLKRADQILEVNSVSFEHVSRQKAMDLLTSSCHLAITVKSNLHAFNEMMLAPEDSHLKPKTWINTNDWTPNGNGLTNDFAASLNLQANSGDGAPHSKKEEKHTFVTLKAHKLKEKILASLAPRNSQPLERLPRSDESVSSHSSASGQLYRSRSNPDLSTNGYVEGKSEFPDHVLKVYRGTDQSTRFLPVNKETTAREVVMLSLPNFNISDPSKEYALFEVSVTEQGVVRQKMLSPDLKNLAERIGLNSRYYIIKRTDSTKPQPSEVISDLVRESQVSILQISSVEVAIQLTLEDFTVFRQMELTEYIDNLFKLKSKYGTPALSKFEEISNKELYWVCTEVCSEPNLVKRAKIIKQFIKIAKHCKDVKNFNSMFALLSGLGNGSVSRLRHTWARVSSRYKKTFNDLEAIMDPSRNMSKYRNLINCEASQPPMIPFFPIAMKDLTFHHFGNEDKVDGLINFEKLRMISRSIRELGQMCSTRYDPKKMLEQLGQPQNSALTAMNQGITGGQHHHITTVKRRKKSTAQPDKKKMFEEAQMVRRVKAYLGQLKIIRDEDELLKMSYECEPPANGTGAGGAFTFTAAPKPDNSSGTKYPSNHTTHRPNSPSPSTGSSTSSTSEGKKHLKTHTKFGAGSPTSERKMLALAEITKKPFHGPRPSTVSLTHDSPNPSPGALRRGPVPSIVIATQAARTNHERSHSDTPVNSVDLSAESSSVTSLSSLTNLRKSRTSVSVSSNECHNQAHGETDSGISTQYDCHSSSSLEGGIGNSYDTAQFPPSPPNPHRRFSHQPDTNFRPIAPHGIAVLPPMAPDVCNNRLVRRGPSGAPPDYTSTQMRMQQLGRTVSHDGAQYYPHPRRDAM